MESSSSVDLLPRLWRGLGGEPAVAHLATLVGPERLLPSVFDVTGLASAIVGVASLAAAELAAVRNDEPVRSVRVDRRQASAAFISETLFTSEGWRRPQMWDPIAGDYRAGDGWIRLHTNYRHHREAAEKVIGAATDRATVAAEVRRWPAHELQDAIVASGGCSAAMNDRRGWLDSPPGASSALEPIARIESRSAATPAALAGPPVVGLPLSGIRVLDLTRVIAGPVCTRFLAAYGADVLRIDPPRFDEVAALVPETSAGKRCAMLDLTSPTDRTVFQTLLGQAHVLVVGLRPGALDDLGYDVAAMRSLNPGLIRASLDAYGWSGEWSGRRGFDSLVQMSSGIAAAGSVARGADHPVPLPAQALDHGTGYLLAAAITRALTGLLTTATSADIRCSLIGTANVLADYPTADGLDSPVPDWSPADTEPISTEWGPARRVPVPGRIDGIAGHLRIDPGRLGRHPPTWITS